MVVSLDSKDKKILGMVQQNCRLTAREISERVGAPITTVFAKLKRMERQGLVRGYHAVLNASKLNMGTTAFILASFAYRDKGQKLLSQREIAREIAGFPEVQEVHIISGEWDILMKVKAKDVDTVGEFVVDKLRLVEGIQKTLTCLVFVSEKESTSLPI